MRRVIVSIGLTAILAFSAAASVTAASYGPSTRVDVGLFYDELAQYGAWRHQPDYGWVWSPQVESEDWRPYTIGQWEWTDDYGWLWASDEEFGWAVYHYGRWLEDEELGWVWVPGTEWGPAWVAWREGDEYIGWAPLPPRAGWDAEDGFRSVAQFDEYIPESQYYFVRDRMFVERTVYNYILPTSRARSCYSATHNSTDYRPYRNRIVNRSVDVERLRRVIGHAVPRVRVVDVQTAHGGVSVSGQINLFHPRIEARPELQPPSGRSAQGRAPRTRENERVERERQPSAAERQPVVEREQGAERQRQANEQQAVREREAQTRAVRRHEAETAGGARGEQVHAVERNQAEQARAAQQQREAAAAEQVRRQQEARGLAERQEREQRERQVEAQRGQERNRADSEERGRVHAQPHEERRGPSGDDHANGSSSSGSSSSSGGGASHAGHVSSGSGGSSGGARSSGTSSSSSNNSHASKEKEKEKEKKDKDDKDQETAKRRQNSAAGH